MLAEALAFCADNDAVLVVAKLDRLARSVGLFNRLMENDADVLFCDLPDVPRGAVGKAMLKVMSVMAELEANLATERTRTALDAIKSEIRANGSYTTRSGRKIKQLGNMSNAVQSAGNAASADIRGAKADKFAGEIVKKIQVAERHGTTSLGAIARFLNDLGITTRRGGKWSAVQVQRQRVKQRIE